MREPCWLGVDLGTQSVRAIVAHDGGTVLAMASAPLHSQRSGREHTQSPGKWWDAVCVVCREVTRLVPAGRIGALAIDATSGTCLLTDARLEPASEALMYDDTRAGAEAAEVQARGRALWAEFGYSVQPSWALPKLLWLLRQGGTGAKSGLLLTHQNDFIHQRLAGKRLATDASHALKSGYDLERNEWPLALLSELGFDAALFPETVRPGVVIGDVSVSAAAETGLAAGTPIVSGMTDGCAAQLASGAVAEGSWNSVLGTTLVLKGVTAKRLHDPLGVVYSHRSADGKWLPGGASSTGAAPITKLFQPADLDALAAEATRRGPTTLLTYPLAGVGERFPFLAPEATGFSSRTPTDAVEQYRAILQGVAFMERLSFEYLEMLGASLAGTFSISGGATRSSLWNQIRADVLARPLTIPAVTEAAFGMCVLAASPWSSLEASAQRMVHAGAVVEPVADFEATYAALYRDLLDELEGREWLPATLAAYARKKLRASSES